MTIPENRTQRLAPADVLREIARPEMMALANLLEHPEIGPEIMSVGFAGIPDIKRSNKDLGRVVAIARLELGRDEDALLEWPEAWMDALQQRFPSVWRELAQRVGNGIRALLSSALDFEQAHHTCAYGLLAYSSTTIEQLSSAAERLLVDAIEPLEHMGNIYT
jgi:hypothetical protein